MAKPDIPPKAIREQHGYAMQYLSTKNRRLFEFAWTIMDERIDIWLEEALYPLADRLHKE